MQKVRDTTDILEGLVAAEWGAEIVRERNVRSQKPEANVSTTQVECNEGVGRR